MIPQVNSHMQAVTHLQISGRCDERRSGVARKAKFLYRSVISCMQPRTCAYGSYLYSIYVCRAPGPCGLVLDMGSRSELMENCVTYSIELLPCSRLRLTARTSLGPLGSDNVVRRGAAFLTVTGVGSIESARTDVNLHDPLTPHLLQGSDRSLQSQQRLAKVLQHADKCFLGLPLILPCQIDRQLESATWEVTACPDQTLGCALHNKSGMLTNGPFRCTDVMMCIKTCLV